MKKLGFRKIKFRFSARYLYAGLTIVVLAAGAYLGNFLYQNLYKTIIQSDQIILLKREVAPDTLDPTQIESVLTDLEQKIAPAGAPNIAAVQNPFRSPVDQANNARNID